MLDLASSIGDAGAMGRWTDVGVHGGPHERRQAAGIGCSTADGAYCVAYGGWQDTPPAPLFSDTSIRLEPFADPVQADDGSYAIELPGAFVQVWASDHAPGTAAWSVIVDALLGMYPDATWQTDEPADGWIEAYGWAIGNGATVTFIGIGPDGTPFAGIAALLIDPSGIGELYVSFGMDTEDGDLAIAQAQPGLGALTWGYCDPTAEITDTCEAA